MLTKLGEYEQRSPWIPYIYAILGNITIILMQINMKILTRTVTPFIALFMRGALLLFINTFVVRANHLKVDQPSEEVHSILMKRSVFSTLALTCFMSTVAYIPIGIANSLFNTGPIFIHFLKALHRVHFILTVICFIGVLFIIKPEFLFGEISKYPLIFMILPTLGALFNSFSMLYLHELKNKVSNLIALQYFYIAQVFFTAFLQNFQQAHLKKPIALQMFLSVLGLVAFAYLTQNLVTRAIYLKKASYIMPFGYISIVVAFISDIVFFDASFDWISILGMILTSAGLLSKLLVKES